MKRRIFIRNIASACGALTISSPLICHRVLKKRSLGVALVGLGSYSTYQLAPALQKTKYCHLAGIVTGSPEKISAWQEKYSVSDRNVYNYENMHQVADNSDIDVVYVVVPTGLHAKYSIIAANAGKHVWCEKPMAMNAAECLAIIDACKKTKRKLCIGYRMQHEANTKTLISLTKEKSYGNILKVDAQAGYRGGGGSGWRFQKHMGGGALYDMGVYTVNGIRYASQMGVRKVIQAEQFTTRPQLFTEVDETTDYTLELSDGTLAHGRASVGESINHLRVECQKGWYELRPMQSYTGVKGSTSDGKLLDSHVDSQQAAQMDDNALAILEDRDVMVPGEEGYKDICIIEAIIESASLGNSIDVEY